MEFLRKEDDEVLFIYGIGLEYLLLLVTLLNIFDFINLYTKMILLFFDYDIQFFFPGKVY